MDPLPQHPLTNITWPTDIEEQIKDFQDGTGHLVNVILKHKDNVLEEVARFYRPLSSLKCDVFRRILVTSKSSARIPSNFRFLTKNGWPVQLDHENEIAVSTLMKVASIMIQYNKDISDKYEENVCIVGIRLKNHDGYGNPRSHGTITAVDDGFILGSVVLPSMSFETDEFRYILKSKMPTLPEDFIFLNSEGWQVQKIDEKHIGIKRLTKSGIVTIQKHFDVPRLGIKWHDAGWIGYITIHYYSILTEVRKIIQKEFDNLGTDFLFLEKNKWPIAKHQEEKNTVFDICIENYCVIEKMRIKKTKMLDQKIKKRPLQLNEERNRKKSFQAPSLNSNSILISYVHCEAMAHARNLKDELRNMGLDSVFLDIDDIPAGQDWQDVINSALNNCSAFVALVTPRYGETRWTNREAKLADDKEKLIIPISFLKKWPPDQLAIQFLSKQYIPWRTDDDFVDADNDNDDDINDITCWDQRCVHRVAKEIKKLCSTQEVSTPDSSSLLDDKSFADNGSASFFNSPTRASKKKDYIVVSAHCNQKSLVEQIMLMLMENGYAVWSSIDMAYLNKDIDSACEDSQISEASPVFDSYCHSKAFGAASFLNSSPNLDSQNSNGKSYGNGGEYLQGKISTFKRKIKGAYLVVIILSQDYMDSSICRQQAFYCEQRREVIVIKYGDFQIDNNLLNFYPEQDMIKFTDCEDNDSLFASLKKELMKTSSGDSVRKTYKDRIQSMVTKLSVDLNVETCVYVIGRTERLSKNAEHFCVVLGTELAKLSSLVLVTEGFFGVCEYIGKNFCEEREIRDKGNPKNVYHVIPYRDARETEKGRQDDDGSFQKLPYGQTLFYGDSISERDDIVTSTFKICIFIGGDERSTCLAEKFLWNDCIVIPIIFNSRAISMKHCLNKSLSKVPCGVVPSDWNALWDLGPAEVLAKTVKKIISSLLKTRKLCARLSNGANKTKH